MGHHSLYGDVISVTGGGDVVIMAFSFPYSVQYLKPSNMIDTLYTLSSTLWSSI